MPINPNILLQSQIADIGAAVKQGFDTYSAVQAGQLNRAKLEKMQYEADLLKAGTTASNLKPFIAAKDYAGFKTELQKSGLSQEDMDTLDTYARANRWDQLGGVADQYIQTARDAGVFQRDYAAAGASGYTPSSIQLFEYRKKLAQEVAQGTRDQSELDQFDNIVRSSQMVSGGGGTTYRVNPITGRTEEVDISGTGGAGAMPTTPTVPAGRNVTSPSRNERVAISPQELYDYMVSQGMPENILKEFRDRMSRMQTSTGGAQPPDRVYVPPPTDTGRNDQVLEEPIGGRAAATIRGREAASAGTKRLAEEAAKDTAALQNEANRFSVNKAGFDEAYPDFRLGEILAKAPNSKIGQIFAQGIGNVIQGLPEVDADFELNSVFRAAVGLIPFPPGSQSEAEQKAREAEVGQLTDPKTSKDVRIRNMRRLLDREQAKARARWNIVNDDRKRLGLDEIPNPFVKRPGSEPTGNMTQPAATGGVAPGQFKVRRVQ